MITWKQVQVFRGSYKRQIILVTSFVLVIGIWSLFHFVYENPTRVFNSMLSESLTTTGVIERTIEIQSGEALDQYYLVQLGGRNRIAGTELEAVVGNKNVSILSAKIGTPSTDYSSFISINSGQTNKSGQLINFKPIIGKWGRAYSGSSTGGQLLRDALLNGILIGDVSNAQRQQILSYIHNKDIYKILSVKKQMSGGRLEYNYSLRVNLEPYSVILNTFDRDLGYQDFSVSNSTTLKGQSLKLNVTVDVLSRHLTQVSYVGEDISANYSAYGIKNPIKLPNKSITVAQLENQINSLGNK